MSTLLYSFVQLQVYLLSHVMNRKNLGYSSKNIPIPSRSAYLKMLMEKVESFIKRMRWKAYFFDNKEPSNENKHENFGFRSSYTPPVNPHLTEFENDLYELIRNIEFRETNDEFLRKLKDDMRDIGLSKNLFIQADKTNNLYEIPPDHYKQLLKDNITKSYQKCDESTKQNINKEAKNIAEKLNLDAKMQSYTEKNAYITIKDHKPNFPQNVKCRLINPAKTEVGIVSKHFLENIVKEVSKNIKANQWRNTQTVIEWFKGIKTNSKTRFIKFDIVDFYPSISEELLDKSIAFAKTITVIDDNSINIIKHSRKSLLFDNTSTWIKKGNVLFDVTMGSYDGAEICELVGLYLLHTLTDLIKKEHIGLYRDDGLAVVLNANGPKMDKLRKSIIEVFKNEGLSITIETNLQETDFLDVTFNVTTKIYKPYRKPSSSPLYINIKSNHPNSILKTMPEMINQRISDTSCNEKIFNDAKGEYEAALSASGFKPHMHFVKTRAKRKNRQRNIIWFNPPFSRNVKTNIGKVFLKIVKNRFGKNNKYHTIFNRNTLKLSYSCTTNVANLIKGHNNKILNSEKHQQQKPCNCRQKDQCPLKGECLATCVVYKAEVTHGCETEVYYGQCETEFKLRFNNHTKSFRHRKHSNETELSKLIWKLKDKGEEYELRWSIAARASQYKKGSSSCDLCLTEKATIIRAEPKGLLNKRTELISKCRHRNKHMLRALR